MTDGYQIGFWENPPGLGPIPGGHAPLGTRLLGVHEVSHEELKQALEGLHETGQR